MLALLLTTVLVVNENATTYLANKTITFSGKIPIATCKIDSYSDKELTQINKHIICPDNKFVTVKKEYITLDNQDSQEVWVIEYEKND